MLSTHFGKQMLILCKFPLDHQVFALGFWSSRGKWSCKPVVLKRRPRLLMLNKPYNIMCPLCSIHILCSLVPWSRSCGRIISKISGELRTSFLLRVANRADHSLVACEQGEQRINCQFWVN